MKGTPLWTYFNLATAHQWLCLGHIEPLWDELRWFLRRQASPGLYTWWEGNGEENNFGRWEKMVRGWVKPPHVTPHYWTAAEMLLLQLDMLVFLDESEAEPVLIVGGGVPKDWLSKPMRVEGAPTKVGTVDWVWQDGKMSVKLRGGRCRVKLGPAFPPATPVETRM
jgi:hypothetical protein